MENVTNHYGIDMEVIVDNFKNTYPIATWKNFGFYKDEYLNVVNIHWLKFGPPPASDHYILAFLYTTFMLVGLSGNFIVVFLFYRYKSLRTPGNLLAVNLAISDFLMMAKTPIFIYNSILLGPALGNLACQVYGFVGGLTGTVSICTLVAISLDRYYTIKYPLKRSFSYLRVKSSILLTWFYGVIFATIPLLDIGLGTYVPEGYLTSCSFDYLTFSDTIRKFIWAYFVAAYVLPLIIIAYCYISILCIVTSRRKTPTHPQALKGLHRHIKEEEKRSQEIKLSLTVFAIISLWFVSWTPYAIVALLGVTGNSQVITPLTSMVPALFCKTASCVDPFVYALNHPKFKEKIRTKCFAGCTKRTQRLKKVFSGKSRVSYEEREITDAASEVIEIEIGDIGIESEDHSMQRSVTVDNCQDDDPVLSPNEKRSMYFGDRKVIPFYTKVFRPDFSNRSSSVRRLANRLTMSQRRNMTIH